MWCRLGQGAPAGKRELLVIVAALASVRASHGTAGGHDRPVPGWKQRARLNMGLAKIQCSIQGCCVLPAVLGASFQSRNDAPCSSCHSWAHFSPSCPSLLLAASPRFGPVSPEMGCGYLLRVLGLCRSMRGLLGAGSSQGGYFFWQRDQEVCSSG